MTGGPSGRTRSDERTTGRDRGSSFIEMLVSIVLIGLAVIATLAALRTTIIGTRIERDHAKAQQWLQSAVGIIDDENFADCGSVSLDGPTIRDAYQAAIDYDEITNPDGAKPPFGFEGGSVAVLIPEVWDGTQFVDFSTQTQCYDDVLLRQQLVTVEVTGPDGEIIETVQIVKRDRPGGGP